MKTYTCKGVCPYDCPSTCGLLLETDGKKLYSVKGDPDHPTTKGMLCRKMQHYEEDVNSPERITTPLKRVGKKGDPNAFVPISWDEAIKIITDNWKELIQNYGSDCILPYSYAGTLGTVQRNCGEAFFYKLGSAFLDRTICSNAKGAGLSITQGATRDWKAETLVDSDYIILWGDNPKATRLHVIPYIKEAQKKGAKVVLIDVYNTISADLTDEVILIKPATDAALILSMMKLLESNGQFDYDFIESYTTGLDALKKEFDSWTPEKASEITGISVETIKTFANEYGSAKKPMIVMGSGMSRYTNGGAAFRLLMCLPALIGAWARGCGTSCIMGSSTFINRTMVNRVDWKQEGKRYVNMNQLGWALTNDDAIKSLYVYISNPSVMTPDQNLVRKGLLREDLFLVVHDRFLTDTAVYADIVLPATFSMEHNDVHGAYGFYHAQTGWKAVDAPGECKSNWDTFCLLAKGMGYEDEFWNRSDREMTEYVLNHPDFSSIPLSDELMETLKKGDPVMFPQVDVLDIKTEDGKIHLTPTSPAYEPPVDQKYPFRLVMSHSPWSLNSNFSYREKLMKSRGPQTVKLHVEDAKALGLEHGDLCKIKNDLGEITVTVNTMEEITRGTAIAEGVYQDRWTRGDGNFSALLTQDLTDYGGASSLNTNTVKIEKI